jgi:hypothetical protein
VKEIKMGKKLISKWIVGFTLLRKSWSMKIVWINVVILLFGTDVLIGNTGNITDPLSDGKSSPKRTFWLNSITGAEGTPAENLTSFTTVYGGKRFNIIEYKFLPNLFRKEELDSLRKLIGTEREIIKGKCEVAHRKGWKTFLNTYEVDYPRELDERQPEVITDIDKRLWFLESKVYEIFTEMPYLDGLKMTTSEAMASAWSPDLSAKYVEAAYKALKRVEIETGKEKLLILRTWRTGPSESMTLKFYPLPLKEDLSKKVIFEIKNTNGDYSMTNPFNPLIEKLKGSNPIMEFDVRGEYRGFSWFPQAMGKRWKEHLLKGIENNVIGVSYGWVNFEWPGENGKINPEQNWGSGYPFHNVWANLNSHTLTELIKDITQDPDDIYRRWINLHFGKKAEDPLLKIINLSYDVLSNSLYTRGIKNTDHSAFADNSRDRSALDREDYTFMEYYTLFWHDGMERIHIDRENVESMIKEKVVSTEGARKMLEILQDYRQSFNERDFLHLETCLKGMVNYTMANRYFMECYLRYRLSKSLVGVEQKKEIDTIFTIIKKAHELQLEEPDFPGRIGPKNFTILMDTIAGILLGDVPTYTKNWDLMLYPLLNN